MSLSFKQIDSIVECKQSRISLWEGAVRSGKTFATLIAFFDAVAAAPHSGLILIAGRTLQTIERNILDPMMDRAIFGPLAAAVTHTRGSSVARILGRDVHLIGAADARAEEKLRGLTACLAMLDEATLVPEAFWNQLLARLSVPGARLLATTNPGSPAHWLKTKFLDRQAALGDGFRSWRFTLDDNPSLTPEYVAALKAEQTGLFYRRNILGEWVAAEGAIFDSWDPDVHVTPWDAAPPMARYVGVGIDYGTTNATSAVLVGQDRAGVYWLVDEYRYDPKVTGRRLTDQRLATRLRAWLLTPHSPHTVEPMVPALAVDPAAASFKVELTNMGLPVVNADNDVTAGIARIGSLLGASRLHVTDRCHGFITEAPGYSWDPKATEHGDDKPLKTADHSLDAARYGLMLDPHDLRATAPTVTGLG